MSRHLRSRSALPVIFGLDLFRRRRPLGVRFERPTPGGGDGDAAGGGWPDFQIPDGVGGTGAGNGDQGGAPQAGSDAAGQPAGSAQGAQVPAAGGAAGQTPAGQQPTPGSGQPGQPGQLPQYRVDQILAREQATNQRLEQTLGELNRIRQGLGAALGFVTGQGQPKQLNEAEQRVVNRIFELIPGLPKLLALEGKLDQINGLIDSAPQMQQQSQAYWNRLATTTYAKVSAEVAPLVLGEGKTAKDLTPAQNKRLGQMFYAFVAEDPQRVQRYESGDESLVGEFRTELETSFFAPTRRVQQATVINRAAAAARLPQGGAANPVTTGTQQPNATDPDAVHGSGWAYLQNARAAAQ